MEVKALSICEPYASAILLGIKTLETRTWTTEYRDWIYIQVPKKVLGSLSVLVEPLVFKKVVSVSFCRSLEGGRLPSGYIVGAFKVRNCRRMTEEDEDAACCKLYLGAMAWEISEVGYFEQKDFVPCKGKLMLFSASIPNSRKLIPVLKRNWRDTV